ncbi:hypothetical protein BDZ91DRAFT_169779 [Kalaharituber pfeilii]|nr:hypothetical protein BDZ91DRAFT_169779 [Kalaharituber pfeilii]
MSKVEYERDSKGNWFSNGAGAFRVVPAVPLVRFDGGTTPVGTNGILSMDEASTNGEPARGSREGEGGNVESAVQSKAARKPRRRQGDTGLPQGQAAREQVQHQRPVVQSHHQTPSPATSLQRPSKPRPHQHQQEHQEYQQNHNSPKHHHSHTAFPAGSGNSDSMYNVDGQRHPGARGPQHPYPTPVSPFFPPSQRGFPPPDMAPRHPNHPHHRATGSTSSSVDGGYHGNSSINISSHHHHIRTTLPHRPSSITTCSSRPNFKTSTALQIETILVLQAQATSHLSPRHPHHSCPTMFHICSKVPRRCRPIYHHCFISHLGLFPRDLFPYHRSMLITRIVMSGFLIISLTIVDCMFVQGWGA